MRGNFGNLALLFLLVCGTAAAQPNKGQGNAGQPAGQPAGQQPGNSNQAQNVQPQMYALKDLPKTRKDALANLKYKGKIPPRFIWYKTVTANSTALPVLLVPMVCSDKPEFWQPGAPEYDRQFAEDCAKISAGEGSLAPSIPTQNQSPLIAGQGVVIAIYDKDDLLGKFKASFVGLSIQSQTGSYLTLGTLRPSLSSGSASPGGAAPAAAPTGGGGPGGSTPLRELIPPPGICGAISKVEGDNQGASPGVAFSHALRVRVTNGVDKDGKPVPSPNVDVGFFSPIPDKYGNVPTAPPYTVLAKTDRNGYAQAHFIAGTAPGGYSVTARCADDFEVNFHLFNATTYYIPWMNNPIGGDTILSVTVTAQTPTPTPLTVTTNPSDVKLRFTINGQRPPFDSAQTQAFPIGSTVTVGTSTDQFGSDGIKYKFVRWSDGGRSPLVGSDPSHDVVIGSAQGSLTAEFTPVTPTRNGDDYAVPVTVVTNPAGITINVVNAANGRCAPDELVLLCHPDDHPVATAPPYQNMSGKIYYFRGWSDGKSALVRDIDVKGEPITLVANYSEVAPPSTGFPSILAATNVPGSIVNVNGIGYVSPQALSFPAGTPLDIEIPAIQNLSGKRYEFDRWSNGVLNPKVSIAFSDAASFFPAILKPPTTPAVPMPVVLSLTTTPTGMPVAITDATPETVVYVAAGGPLPTPYKSGDKITVNGAGLPQYRSGTTYAFQSWDDKGSARHDITLPLTNNVTGLSATFTATPVGGAIPVTVSTNPPGLSFSVNGKTETSATVAFLTPGSTATLNTDSPQSRAGIQYTFQGWSDGGSNNTSTNHTYTVPGGTSQNAPNGNQNPTQPGTTPQTQSPTTQVSAASVTAVFTPSTPLYTEQSLTLLSTSYAQTHNPSYFNVSTGMVVSTLRSPSWTRAETAPAVTCAAGAPQPCVASPALYQTVMNPNAAHTVDPVLFFTVYLPFKPFGPFDAERKWRTHDLIPEPTVGLSLSSPATDYFFGVTSEVIRGVQLVGGRHIGKVGELAPTGVNDPTSSTAPATVQKFHPGWFFGVTFNINFIQTLFGGKGGG